MIRNFFVLLVMFASHSWADTPPVRIGAIYGFTGFANVWSLQARRGIELARDEINASGGINGRQLEIIFEDSGTTPTGGVSAFNKLVQSNHVDALVGDIISFVTLPLVPLAQANRVVLVTPSIFDSDLPENSDYFFTTCPPKSGIVPPVDKFFSINPDIRTVAIICADNTWGRTYLDVWRSAAGSHKVRIVDENCTNEYPSDMRAEVLRAKSKNPDAVIVAFNVDRVLRRMKELHFSPRVLATSDIDEAIHSRGFPMEDAVGVYFGDWLPSQHFSSRFQSRYKEVPIMEPQNSYEAIRVLAEGFRLGGDLQNAIQQLVYIGATGPVDFRGSRAGNKAEATLLVVTKDGIKPVE